MLSSFSYGKVKAYFLSRGYSMRELRYIRSTRPTVPTIGRVKFMAAIRADGAPGCGIPGAGPSLAWLLRAHPPRWVAPIGNGVHIAFTVPVRKRVKQRMDVLGMLVSGQLRRGACSAAPAGEAETQTQSGSSCRAG